MQACITSLLRAVTAGLLALALCMSGPIGDAAPALAGEPSEHPGERAPPGSRAQDLTAVRAMASRAVTFASRGEFASARRQMQMLKRGWDGAKAGLRARVGPVRWQRTNRSLDDALDALQAERPSQAEVSLALSDLLLALYALDSID